MFTDILRQKLLLLLCPTGDRLLCVTRTSYRIKKSCSHHLSMAREWLEETVTFCMLLLKWIQAIFFFFCVWGWRKFHLSHFSLWSRLYSNPFILVPLFISRCTPCQTAWETCVSERRKYGRENGRPNFARQSNFYVIAGFFNMPQSCGMGQTALLPLRRKACWGFCRPKNPTASAGFEPANLGTRGQHANH
jgi:hypothetical protein